ncbi:MAG: hypothetical protein ACI9HK_001915, partial [Pirellulaceae bacterium]
MKRLDSRSRLRSRITSLLQFETLETRRLLALIAEDSFSTTDTGDGGTFYDHSEGLAERGPTVVNGTTGFSAARPWGVSTSTSIVEASNGSSGGDAGGALTHNLVNQEEDGLVVTWSSHNRHN